MNITSDLLQRIEKNLNRKICGQQSISGGDHASAWRIQTEDNKSFFLKTVQSGSPFHVEALGLKRLDCEGGIRVPNVLGVDDQYLLLEWIPFGPPGKNFQCVMGRQLAQTHLHCRSSRYGFDADHFIGATPQKNQPWVTPSSGSWTTFWWTHRISPMLDRLEDARLNRLGRQLSDRLETLLVEPVGDASLLHGDLWSGNVGSTAQGDPVMFDPAPYYGHPEAELAMTRMFGGFTKDFYGAYTEVFSLSAGWEDRQDLYMLYHVLNHAVLFGGSYRHQAERLMQRYV